MFCTDICIAYLSKIKTFNKYVSEELIRLNSRIIWISDMYSNNLPVLEL